MTSTANLPDICWHVCSYYSRARNYVCTLFSGSHPLQTMLPPQQGQGVTFKEVQLNYHILVCGTWITLWLLLRPSKMNNWANQELVPETRWRETKQSRKSRHRYNSSAYRKAVWNGEDLSQKGTPWWKYQWMMMKWEDGYVQWPEKEWEGNEFCFVCWYYTSIHLEDTREENKHICQLIFNTWSS